jgi:release factor glutamine methyltransferase
MQNFSDGKVPVADNKAASLLKLFNTRLRHLYESPELENIGDWLLEHFAKVNKQQLLLQPEIHVNQSNVIHFCNAVELLEKGTPIQYVIGVVSFYGLTLQVNPSVLIPRPETEELVDLILKENNGRESLRILDIGTGSGCIALSLAKQIKNSRVTAIDISADAIKTAAENACINHIENVEFLEMDFLEENYFTEKEFDIIVSNPPYIAHSEGASMHKNVLDFEPATALFVSDTDPLIFYKRIAEVSNTYLKTKGMVYVEINERLGEETVEVFPKNVFSSVLLLKDMFTKNRFIKGIRI